ncbi:TIGR03618 family F420-dependent PPOX class oxidoreductase [Antrihabitans stalactiti]|uniref:PPOX class F420-dependent oxidoreductase n=1 Tax=Antrihabitans stalactiti TaxID=2584121 RepID=A0A848KLZ1_9NOCA|nr:PPOX class F420-dependent oxidoreductase [Antrihabitans stalactiti]
MSKLPESARALIESGRLAHCVTVNADGSPQVSGVWVGLDGDDIVMAHIPRNAKVRNLQRDPRIVLSIQADGKNPIGMQEYLVVHGTATVTEGGAADVLNRLVKVYASPDAEFPLPPGAPPGFVVHISPDRLGGFGPWVS